MNPSLLEEAREVLEQRVLRPQEVELVVALLPVHQVGQELAAVARHELRRQLDHVQVEGRDGGRVGCELEVRRGVLGRRRLLGSNSIGSKITQKLTKIAQNSI